MFWVQRRGDGGEEVNYDEELVMIEGHRACVQIWNITSRQKSIGQRSLHPRLNANIALGTPHTPASVFLFLWVDIEPSNFYSMCVRNTSVQRRADVWV